MNIFQLQTLYTIQGIGSASGIVKIDDLLYIISDNSSFLYQYNTTNQELTKTALVENAQENIPKKEKLDFESIANFNDKLYLFGSGSTKKRETRISYNINSKKIKTKSISKVYNRLKKIAQLSNDEINIEGSIVTNDSIYFFQRGNGNQGKNGIFLYDRLAKTAVYKSIDLPKINNILATFTDAVMINETIYFLAAVENSSSTYLDGEIYGSFIGSLNLKTFELNFIQQISNSHKFEGLTLNLFAKNEVEFLLCEDNDTKLLETTIYKLNLEL